MALKKNTLNDYIEKLKALSAPKEGSEEEFATVLATLKNEGEDTVVELGVARSEAAGRKTEVRTLDTAKSELEQKIAELTEKVNAGDPNKDELETLRVFRTNTINGQKDTFKQFIEKVAGHDNFQKVLPDLKLPKPGEDGKYNLDNIEPADLEHNVNEMARYNRLGIFGDTAQPVKKVDGSGPEKIVPKDWNEKVKATKSIKELEALQDA